MGEGVRDVIGRSRIYRNGIEVEKQNKMGGRRCIITSLVTMLGPASAVLHIDYYGE